MRKLILFYFCIVLNIFVIIAQTVPENPTDISPLLSGETVPEAICNDKDGKEINIKSHINGKATVLVFFRGGWCPYCNAQLSGLQQIEKEITALGFQIVAITPDKVADIPSDIEKGKLTYQLLSDSKINVGSAFGIAYRNEATIKNYNGLLQKASGEEHGILPVPSVFIIDKTGKILFEYINPNIKERLNEKVLLAILKEVRSKN